MNSTII